MTETERHYAQIEREALGITWAAEKLSEYITGIHVVFETDHKPLVQILQSKNLDTLTPRLQRFRMRLMRYDYSVVYVPGKDLTIADALSRSPIPHNTNEPQELAIETEAFVRFIVRNLPVKDYYLEKIIDSQTKDPICKLLLRYTSDGWPTRDKLPDIMVPYYQYRYDISFSENLLLKDTRIIIPSNLQEEIINYIHVGHQGITKCRRLAQTSVWWLGLSTQLEELIKNCPQCIEERINKKEPFNYEGLPNRPMEQIGIDLFKLNKWYLIIVDYYSRYFEIVPLTSMNEESVIEKMKEFFARFGICNICRSDNGPQFQSKFRQFALDYHFKHVTSSPYYSQSNGAAEAAVKTAKNLIKKGNDIHESLLNYRSTPLANGFSPAELMMGRKLRSLVPMMPSALETTNNAKVRYKEKLIKEKQIQDYNRRHGSKNLTELKKGDKVWITDLRKYGFVLKKLDEPRSYLIQSDREKYRRNRWHLIPVSINSKNIHDTEELYNPNENFVVEDINDRNDQQDITEVAPSVQTEVIPEVGISVRPARQRKPPSWMKDFV